MRLPLKDCYVTSPYGVVRSNGKVHTGIDLISKCGDREVRAIKGGVYRGSYWDAYGYGNYVVIEHDDGIRALYCHLKSVESISVGKRIEEGQLLGIEGTTGNSTGVHLHLEIRESPYTPKFHKNIAEYLGIENSKGYVIPIKEEEEEEDMRYSTLKDIKAIPEQEFYNVIKELVEHGYIRGISSAENIDDTVVDLPYDIIRMYVTLYRAGVFSNLGNALK